MPLDLRATSGKFKRMSDHHWSWTAVRSLPSLPGAHLAYAQEVSEELKRLGWSGRDLFGIELALEESLSNAIHHGNRLDESKQVLVECKLSPERFWLRVRDEGPGFQPQLVPDCTADENLDCSGGRGLALIRAYMNRVEHNDRGNCVTMEKNRSDAAFKLPNCRSCDSDESTQK